MQWKIQDVTFFVTILSIQDNTKRSFIWCQALTKVKTQAQNQYLDFLVDPSEGMNISFVLLLSNNVERTSLTKYFLAVIEKKDYNPMIDGRSFFDQSVKADIRTSRRWFHN